MPRQNSRRGKRKENTKGNASEWYTLRSEMAVKRVTFKVCGVGEEFLSCPGMVDAHVQYPESKNAAPGYMCNSARPSFDTEELR